MSAASGGETCNFPQTGADLWTSGSSEEPPEGDLSGGGVPGALSGRVKMIYSDDQSDLNCTSALFSASYFLQTRSSPDNLVHADKVLQDTTLISKLEITLNRSL